MSSLRETTYVDNEGRQWAVLLPEEVPDSLAVQGVPIGPPSLSALNLPIDIEVRLHNQLFARHLLTEREVRARPEDVMGALMAALKVDKQKLIAVYDGPGGAEGVGSGARSVASEDKSDANLDHRGQGRTITRAGLPGKGSGRRSNMAAGRHHAHPRSVAG